MPQLPIQTSSANIDIGKYSEDSKQITKNEFKVYGSNERKTEFLPNAGNGTTSRPKLSYQSQTSIHFVKGMNFEDASDEVNYNLSNNIC